MFVRCYSLLARRRVLYFQRVRQISSQKQFRDCVFNHDLAKLQVEQERIKMNDWFQKYQFLYKMSQNPNQNINLIEQISQKDPYLIAISLQWLAIVSINLNKYIVNPETYLRVLNKYYQSMGIHKNSNLNSALFYKSNIISQHILPKTYIYLWNTSVVERIKLQQVLLLQKFIASNLITQKIFMSIINSSIFNIIDMPLIFKYFYQALFPSIKMNIASLHAFIDYISHFSLIPDFLFSKIMQTLKKQLQKREISIDDFIRFSHILHRILFKFSNQLESLQLTSMYKQIFLQLFNKTVQLPSGVVSVSQFIFNHNSALQKISGKIFNSSQNRQFLNQLKVLLKNQPKSILDQVLRSNLDKFQDKNKISDTVLQKIELQVKPAAIFLVLIGVQTNLISYSHLFKIFQSQEYCSFLMRNATYPNLLKTYFITLDTAKQQIEYKLYKKTEIMIETYLEMLRIQINTFLNKQIKKFTKQLIANDPNALLSLQFPDRSSQIKLADESSIFSFSWILKDAQYAHNQVNYLRMLKNDQVFMLSLLEWCQTKKIHQIKTAKTKNLATNTWRYPYYYNYIYDQQTHKIKGSLINKLRPSVFDEPTQLKQIVKNIKSIKSLKTKVTNTKSD